MTKNTVKGTTVSTAIATITAVIVGTPAPNDSAKDRPLTAFIGLRDSINPALSGAPENSKHKEKNIMVAAIIEINVLFCTTASINESLLTPKLTGERPKGANPVQLIVMALTTTHKKDARYRLCRPY